MVINTTKKYITKGSSYFTVTIMDKKTHLVYPIFFPNKEDVEHFINQDVINGNVRAGIDTLGRKHILGDNEMIVNIEEITDCNISL